MPKPISSISDSSRARSSMRNRALGCISRPGRYQTERPSPSPSRGRVGWGCSALALTRGVAALPHPLPPPRRGGGARSRFGRSQDSLLATLRLVSRGAERARPALAAAGLAVGLGMGLGGLLLLG